MRIIWLKTDVSIDTQGPLDVSGKVSPCEICLYDTGVAVHFNRGDLYDERIKHGAIRKSGIVERYINPNLRDVR